MAERPDRPDRSFLDGPLPARHGVALGDLDGDLELDAFVVYNGAFDRVYSNDGAFFRFDPEGASVPVAAGLPSMSRSGLGNEYYGRPPIRLRIVSAWDPVGVAEAEPRELRGRFFSSSGLPASVLAALLSPTCKAAACARCGRT